MVKEKWETDQNDRIQNPGTDPHIYHQVAFSKGTKAILWRKMSFQNTLLGTTTHTHMQKKKKINLNPHLAPLEKLTQVIHKPKL